MGLETAPQAPLGRIDPNSMIGLPEPVVTPSAVAALSDAFRKGVVTSDDIIARYGELAQSRKKSELQTLDEGRSPEAVQLRHTTTGAQQAQGELARQTAEAGQMNLAQQQAIKRLGPFGEMAVETFFRLRNEIAYTEMPVLENGETDWAKVADWGARIGAQKMRKDEAFARLKDSSIRPGAHNGVGVEMHYDSFKNFMTPAQKAALTETTSRKLNVTGEGWDDIKPGAVVPGVAPAAEAIPFEGPMPAPVPGMPTRAGAIARTEPPAKQTFSAGDTIPGVGVATGLPIPGTGPKTPTEKQINAELALPRLLAGENIYQTLTQSGYDPTTILSWADSMMPEVVKSGDRKSYDFAMSAWTQGLLRLESGAAISHSEKDWYAKAFFPVVNDPPAVVAAKQAMRSNIARMVSEISQAGGVVSPESAAAAKGIYQQGNAFFLAGGGGGGGGAAAQPGASAVPIGPTQTMPNGRKFRWDQSANGGRGGFLYLDAVVTPPATNAAPAIVQPNRMIGDPSGK